jgi:hypothetical protein
MMMESVSDIPRTLCASASQWDSIWTSQILYFNAPNEDISLLLRKCEQYWSPGLVVILPPIAFETVSLKDIAGPVSSLAARMGKARRITTGIPVNAELTGLLYKSFNCVEFMDPIGNTRILDDGNEKVVEVRISNSL